MLHLTQCPLRGAFPGGQLRAKAFCPQNSRRKKVSTEYRSFVLEFIEFLLLGKRTFDVALTPIWFESERFVETDQEDEEKIPLFNVW